MKTYLLMFICFLFASGLPSKDPVKPLDEWDDVEVLLVRLKSSVDSAVDTAVTQIEIIRGQVATFGDKTLADARALIIRNADTIREQLSSLRILAEYLDAVHCLNNKEKGLDFISSDLQIATESCIAQILEEASIVITDTENFIEQAQDRVSELQTAFQSCERNSEDTLCIVTLRGEVQLALDALVSGILDQTLSMLRYSRDWDAGIGTCANDRTGLIFAEGNRLVSDVEACLTQPADSGKLS